MKVLATEENSVTNDAEIEKMLNSLKDEAQETNEVDSASSLSAILTPKIIAVSIGNITKMVARWAKIKEIAFTPEDEEDLTNALKPFEKDLDKLLKYLPYLPLGMFAVGYGMRIITGYTDKKKKDKEEKDNKAQEVAKAQAEEAKLKQKEGENTGKQPTPAPTS